MSLARYVFRWIACTAMLGLIVLPIQAQLTRQQFDSLKQSVVRVDANQCPAGASQTATGFFWQQNTWVVTALHAVSGCGVISIYSESAQGSAAVKVARVLRKNDLILLELTTPLTGTVPLSLAAQTPNTTEDLEVLGYPWGVPKMNSTTVKLRFGGTILRDIVPQAVTDELIKTHSPDPDIDIVDIDGHLLPGHSGAPILNHAGRLVAIGDGGLERGVVGMNWGLPSNLLDRLVSSPDSRDIKAVQTSNPHLFAADLTAHNGPDVTCGGATFKNIRQLSFADILHATDDPQGLQQIIVGGGMDVSSFTFDVYQQLETGATFVVPANSKVTSDSGMCVAKSTNGAVVLRIATVTNPNDPGAAQTSTQYEQLVLQTLGWQPDPAWTYVAPMQRFDGVIVRRKSFVHFGQYPAGFIMDATLFETLASRKGIFLGVSALNGKWTPQIIQVQIACKQNPGISSNCSEALEDFREWAYAVISVHLATFPFG